MENEVSGDQIANDQVTTEDNVISTTHPVEPKVEEPKSDETSEPEQSEDDESSKEAKNKSGWQKTKEQKERLKSENAALQEKIRQLEQGQVQKAPESTEPKEADYDNVIDFLKDHQKWVAKQEATSSVEDYKKSQLELQQQAQLAVKVQQTEERADIFAKDVPDYYEKVDGLLESGLISQDLINATIDYDTAPQIAYHLANHPADLIQVLSLKGPALKLALDTIDKHYKSTSQAAVKTTKAAPPINPIKANSKGNSKDPTDMDQVEYEKWRGFR